MRTPARYIVTTSGFDTDSRTYAAAERRLAEMNRKFPDTYYAIYSRVKLGRKPRRRKEGV